MQQQTTILVAAYMPDIEIEEMNVGEPMSYHSIR